jgi:hypothetical protein
MEWGDRGVASLTQDADDDLVKRSRVTLDKVSQDDNAVQPLVFISRLFINTDDEYDW